MDALMNFINEPTGTTLGLGAIALAYVAAGIFGPSKGWAFGVKILYIVVGVFFACLAVLCQLRGTVKGVDAGIVLAYLGIGAGLACTAWTASRGKLARVVMIIGVCFEIIALLLLRDAGLI